MALPIKSTPVLEGEDARRFAKQLEQPGEKVTREEYERARRLFHVVNGDSEECQTDSR